MSLEGVRNAAVRAKKAEIANCEQTRRLRLRELYSVTAYLNSTTPRLLDLSFKNPPNADEQQFLDQNDIKKGQTFNEDTLPWPVQRLTSTPKSPRASEQPLSTKLRDRARLPIELEDENRPVSALTTAQETKAIDLVEDVGVDERSRKSATKEERTPGVAQKDGSAANFDPTFADRPQISINPLRQLSQIGETQAGVPNGFSGARDASTAGDYNASFPPLQKGDARFQLSHSADGKSVQKDVGYRLEKPSSQTAMETAQERIIGSHTTGQQLQVPAPSYQLDTNSSPSLAAGGWSPNTSNAAQESANTSPDSQSFVNGVQSVNRKSNDYQRKSKLPSPQDKAVRALPNSASTSAQLDVPSTYKAQLELVEQQPSASEEQKSSLANMGADKSEFIANADIVGASSSQRKDESADQIAVSSGILNISDDTNGQPDTGRISYASNYVRKGDAADEGMIQISNETLQSRGLPPTLSSVTDGDVEMQDATQEKISTPLLDANFPEVSAHHNTSKGKVLLAENVPEIENRKQNSQVVSRLTTHAPSAFSESKALRDFSRRSSSHRPASSLSNNTKFSLRKEDSAKPTNFPKIDPEYINLKGAAEEEGRDYLLALFQWQAYQPPRATPLLQLLGTSHKVLSTSTHFTGIREEQDARLLRRIHQLQSTNRWSFRQLEKCQEPPQVKSHLDFLLGEMRWLQTDFKQERKWKSAAAHNLALWCAEWVRSSQKKRCSLQIKAKPNPNRRKLHEFDVDTSMPSSIATNGLVDRDSDLIQDDEHSIDEDSDEELDLLDSETTPFTAQRIGHDDIYLFIEPSLESNELLDKIPWYDPDKDTSLNSYSASPLSDVAQSYLPVSKYINSKLIPLSHAPTRKRSRYEYEEEEEEEASNSNHHKRISSIDSIHSIHSVRSMSILTSGRVSRYELPPEQTDVALFNPENKHVRDRLHAGHAFRPPSEFGMPSTNFFESRVSSQWLWDEDQKLRSLVREYSYNWSLISASLALPSAFTSGAERRTPWECFERWVQLEGLPAEMSKTPYFKTYQSRLEAAQRTVSAQHQVSQQQSQQQTHISGQQQLGTPVRRRTTQPIRVERRKNNRYLGWIDCMRKLARRRETVQHKQQEAAKAAAMRKAHETVQPKGHVHTPQQLSQMKYDRECKLQQSLELQRQKVVAQQREATIQRLAQQNRQQQALSNGHGVQQRVDGPNVPQVPSSTANPISSSNQVQVAPNMQARPPMTQQGIHPNVPPGSAGHVPIGLAQASMQMNLQDQSRAPHLSETPRRALQQRALQASSQQYQLQQHQQHIGQAGGAPSVQLPNSGGNMANAPMIPSGLSNTNSNGNFNPSAMIVNMGKNGGASPRTGQSGLSHHPQAQALSSGLIPAISHITHQVQTQNPRMSPEQVRQITNERLKGQIYQQTRQNALNAAAGAITAGNNNPNNFLPQNGLPINGSSTTQQYQQQIRQQMMQQRPQQSASPIMSVPRQASSPMIHHTPPQQQQQLPPPQPQQPQQPQAQAQVQHQQQQQFQRSRTADHVSPLQRPVQPSKS